MTTDEVREKYLKFFEKRGHKIISPAPLVLENDPTTLFTSSGMQPLVPYLMGEKHPEGKRLVDSQPCIRTQDIDEVGDNRHTVFFEMLGNWSLGDYFKKEQLAWIWEFFTKELKIPKEKLYVSVFEGLPAGRQGDNDVPRDTQSREIWKSLGVPEDHIFEYGVKENWWSRSGTPDKMPAGEIGGPDSEIFFEFDGVEHGKKFGDKCHPNCDCGRFLEIGNSVFIQYKKLANGKLEELPQKSVDFGGGLERIVAAVNNDPDVFKIDVLKNVVSEIEKALSKNYDDEPRLFRIIADHIRASVFLVGAGVKPGNKQQGYILRRLLRRVAVKVDSMDSKKFRSVVRAIVDMYPQHFDEGVKKNVEDEVALEARKFRATIEKGMRKIEKIEKIDATQAFDLYQSYGFPLEITEEIFEEKGQKINSDEFKREFEKHQEKSRSSSSGKFKGGLADHSSETTQLHTVTHLLHASLRKVLGDHVQQKGSNITAERLRFDFTHGAKLTDEEVKKVEDLINAQIDKKLDVTHETKALKQAKEEGALAFFNDKYDEKVKVYSVGSFSREVCGGPHVNNLSEIAGRVKISKQNSASSGVRRVYAVIK